MHIKLLDTLLQTPIYQQIIKEFNISKRGIGFRLVHKVTNQVIKDDSEFNLWMLNRLVPKKIKEESRTSILKTESSSFTDYSYSQFSIELLNNKLIGNNLPDYNNNCSEEEFIQWGLKAIENKKNGNHKLIPILSMIHDKLSLSNPLPRTKIVIPIYVCKLIDNVLLPVHSETEDAELYSQYYYLCHTESKATKQNIFTANLVEFINTVFDKSLGLVTFCEKKYFNDGYCDRIRFDVAIMLKNKIVIAFNFNEDTDLHNSSNGFVYDYGTKSICNLSGIPYIVMREDENFSEFIQLHYKTIVKAVLVACNLEEDYRLFRIYQSLSNESLDYNHIKYLYGLFISDQNKPTVSLFKMLNTLVIPDEEVLLEFYNPKNHLDVLLESGTFADESRYILYKKEDTIKDILFCYTEIIYVSLDLLSDYPHLRRFIKIFEQLARVSYNILNEDFTREKSLSKSNPEFVMNVWKSSHERTKDSVHHYQSSVIVDNLKRTLELAITDKSASDIMDFISNRISEVELRSRLKIE